MRVAVIGAGIIGVTTAYELAVDGHEVTVFERRGSVAAEGSYANAGVIAAGYIAPGAAPGMPRKLLAQFLSREAVVRMGAMPDAAMLRWIWRWMRACRPAIHAADRALLQRLAQYSRERLHALSATLQLDYEQSTGHLVLLRTARDLALARPALTLLAELGIPFQLIDGQRCREIERGLNADMPLYAGIHLRQDEAGNCRQFAQLLKTEAQRLGAQFKFHHEVLKLTPGAPAQVRFIAHEAPQSTLQSRAFVDSVAFDSGAERDEGFDAVVVCAALGSLQLLRPLGLHLPLQPVYGYSITAPLRSNDGPDEIGPCGAIRDERYRIAISRLGQRIRVAGCAELGGRDDRHGSAALRTLYKVLDDWFPGAARMDQVQTWKGARPTLPDGPPALGACGHQGIWLNLGHGSSGWTLSCGAARVIADAVAGRTPAVEALPRDLGARH